MSNNKKETVQLWGREFDIVNERLSQPQIIAFIAELINENRALVEKIKRLTRIRDMFLPHLENFIAETDAVEEELEKINSTMVEKELETLTLALASPAPKIKSNGGKESRQAETDLESELVPLVTNMNQTETEDKGAYVPDETNTPSPHIEDSVFDEGEIEIAVIPPVNIAQLIRLRRNLQGVTHLRILRTDGSWKKWSVITVFIEKPLPLVNILKEMPEVENAEMSVLEQGTDDEFPMELIFGSKPRTEQQKTIVVTLNSSEVM